MNRLAFGGRENLAITHNSTGEVKQYNAKLLLNNFNTFSQTVIQNPANFSPAIGRLELMSFEWVNLAGDTINNDNCDWNISLQITEEVAANAAAVITGD